MPTQYEQLLERISKGSWDSNNGYPFTDDERELRAMQIAYHAVQCLQPKTSKLPTACCVAVKEDVAILTFTNGKQRFFNVAVFDEEEQIDFVCNLLGYTFTQVKHYVNVDGGTVAFHTDFALAAADR